MNIHLKALIMLALLCVVCGASVAWFCFSVWLCGTGWGIPLALAPLFVGAAYSMVAKIERSEER